MRSMVLAPLLLLALLVGCAAPAEVDGTLSGETFTIRDDNPTLRPQGDGAALLVLADEGAGALRIVQLRVAQLDALPLDEPLPIELDGDVQLRAALGTAESFLRSDGVRVTNMRDATFYPALDGTLTIASRSPLAGDFEATLEGGDRLVGSFVINE